MTAQEQRVLALLALPNKAIAQRLGLRLQTVKNHISHLTGKAGLPPAAERSRVALLTWGLRQGLVSLDEAWGLVCQETGRTSRRLHGLQLFGGRDG